MVSTTLRVIHNEHLSMACILRSLHKMLRQEPGANAPQYFHAMRCMLFYVSEIHEKEHHPKESRLLFPAVRRRAPELAPTLDQLERDHADDGSRVGQLQRLLLAWELLGETHREVFATQLQEFIAGYMEHMRLEEAQVIPAAQRVCTPEDWAAMDAGFSQNHDPLSPGAGVQPVYQQLLDLLTHNMFAPIDLRPA